jgi:hypothetical protein
VAITHVIGLQSLVTTPILAPGKKMILYLTSDDTFITVTIVLHPLSDVNTCPSIVEIIIHARTIFA